MMKNYENKRFQGMRDTFNRGNNFIAEEMEDEAEY